MGVDGESGCGGYSVRGLARGVVCDFREARAIHAGMRGETDARTCDTVTSPSDLAPYLVLISFSCFCFSGISATTRSRRLCRVGMCGGNRARND